jgi:hypothetical protein
MGQGTLNNTFPFQSYMHAGILEVMDPTLDISISIYVVLEVNLGPCHNFCETTTT